MTSDRESNIPVIHPDVNIYLFFVTWKMGTAADDESPEDGRTAGEMPAVDDVSGVRFGDVVEARVSHQIDHRFR